MIANFVKLTRSESIKREASVNTCGDFYIRLITMEGFTLNVSSRWPRYRGLKEKGLALRLLGLLVLSAVPPSPAAIRTPIVQPFNMD